MEWSKQHGTHRHPMLKIETPLSRRLAPFPNNQRLRRPMPVLSLSIKAPRQSRDRLFVLRSTPKVSCDVLHEQNIRCLFVEIQFSHASISPSTSSARVLPLHETACCALAVCWRRHRALGLFLNRPVGCAHTWSAMGNRQGRPRSFLMR